MKKQLTNLRAWLWPALGMSGLVVLVLLVLTAVSNRKREEIRDVLIDIAEVKSQQASLDKQSFDDLLRKSFGITFTGRPLGEIDIRRVEAVLEQDPFVKAAEVWVDTRYDLHILLYPREPVLRIMDGKGQDYYLDIEGNRIPKSKKFWARTLVATGDIPPHVPDFKERKNYLLKDLYELTLDILNDPYMAGLTEQIHLQNGEFVLYPKVGNQKIYLGKYEQIEDKFERLKRFYEKVLPVKGLERYKSIDLRFDGQVVCKKGNGK
ncbi:MAG TPA: hypothetical protein ENJ88_05105 [Phaeodactylibacter sp.]|nr:hypothetical protein [Phaeodactylibacter sp.]